MNCLYERHLDLHQSDGNCIVGLISVTNRPATIYHQISFREKILLCCASVYLTLNTNLLVLASRGNQIRSKIRSKADSESLINSHLCTHLHI